MALELTDLVKVEKGTGTKARTTVNDIVSLASGTGTDLSLGTITATNIPLNSSTGNDVTLPQATAALAGLLIASDKVKMNNITVTQAVDLDQMETDIAALANGMTYQGNWDASAGTFPGGGTAQTGAFYTVSVGGTVDGVVFNVGDRLIATTDNASAATFAGNWEQLDATDAVTSVHGRNGNVIAVNGDYTASQITNVPSGNLAAVTVQAALDELQTELDTATAGTHAAVTLAANTGFVLTGQEIANSYAALPAA